MLPTANPLFQEALDFCQPKYIFPSQAMEPLPHFIDHSRPPKDILNFDCCDNDVYQKENTNFKSLLDLHQHGQLVYQRFTSLKCKYFASPKEPKEFNYQRGPVRFNSHFECGNLHTAYKIAEKKYNLVLQNDTKTKGFNQWYFFSVKAAERVMIQINIVNLTKGYRQLGIAPYTYTARTGWYQGADNVQIYKNSYQVQPDSNKRYFTLSFTMVCEKDETVFFAPYIPYGLTTLQSTLKAPVQQRGLVRLKVLSVGNNDCPVLTMGTAQKPLVILLGRQHPSEVVSSYVMEGIINFLLQTPSLRESFYFKIIPMMNPDGVIHGNSRCNTAGIDVSRKWDKVNKSVPALQHVKALAKKAERVHLLLDIHQSFKRIGISVAGAQMQANMPYLLALSELSTYVHLDQCHFPKKTLSPKSLPTSLLEQMNISRILQVYVASQYSENNQHHNFTSAQLRAIGADLLKALEKERHYENTDFQLTNTLHDISISLSDVSQDLIEEDGKAKRKSKSKQKQQTTLENTITSKRKPPLLPRKSVRPLHEIMNGNSNYLVIHPHPIKSTKPQQAIKYRTRSFSTKTPEWNIRNH